MGVAPAEGIIGFRTSPDAELVVYPRVDPLRIDIMMRKNRVPLDRQLEGLTAQYIEDIVVESIGGGTWFLTLHVSAPEISVTPTATPGRMVLRLAPGTPEVVQSGTPPTVSDLLDNRIVRRPAAPVRLGLTPLRGEASTMRVRPWQVLQSLPTWRNAPVPSVPTSGWPAIESYRATLTQSRDEPIRTAARYRLGMEYLGIGWYREAAFYLEEVLSSEADFDVPAVALAAARAHLVLERTTRTRQLCKLASEAGANDVAVLVCVGTAALQDGRPAPTETARAILDQSRVPEHRLLAAQLLMADHRYAEARLVLEALGYGSDDPWVHASLGDARFMTSDIEGARLAWGFATTRNTLLRRRLVLRMRMAEMVEDGFSEWPGRIPDLLLQTDEEGPVAAEAHYLLAQIAETYGDPELAAEHLNRLWDRFPEYARRSDVPERLIDVCNQRLAMLDRQAQHARQVGFFATCWRRELDTMSSDPAALQRTAALLLDLGLRPEALALQLRAMAVFNRLGQEDTDALAALTRMYVATGLPREALDTIEYAEAIAAATLPAQAFLTAEAQARYELGDVEGALSAWSLAEGEGIPGATRARGMIFAERGQCADAERLLRDSGDDEALPQQGRPQRGAGRRRRRQADAGPHARLDPGDPAHARRGHCRLRRRRGDDQALHPQGAQGWRLGKTEGDRLRAPWRDTRWKSAPSANRCSRQGRASAGLIAEPIAAAIGAGMPITDPDGQRWSSTSAAAPPRLRCCRLADIVYARSVRVGGDRMDEAIISATCAGSITCLMGERHRRTDQDLDRHRPGCPMTGAAHRWTFAAAICSTACPRKPR